MAFGIQDETDEVMNEINMTPLVDVMLVLLIVFIVTIPVMQHAVNVDLPRASSAPQPPKPDAIRLTIDAEGHYLWNERPIADAELEPRLREAAARTPQPQLQLQGDRAARYERVTQALSAAGRAGLHGIGFVTEPAKAP